MLEQFIKNRIKQELPFVANEGQLELLDKLSQFIVSPTPRKAFILRGYAGTGKTSIMAALVGALQQLRQHIVLLAPTGRAAKVLSKYAHVPAYTIHKYIYRARSRSVPSLEARGDEAIRREGGYPELNREYMNEAGEWRLDDLFRAAIPQGEAIRAKELESKIMQMTHIVSFKLYNRLRDEAMAKGIIVRHMLPNGCDYRYAKDMRHLQLELDDMGSSDGVEMIF